MKIGLLMIVKNESENISKCINSAKQLVDDIIVVDTGSTDDTIELAKNLGAKVYSFDWCDDFSKARNYGISKSDCDWHLFLDADESITAGTRRELEHFALENPEAIGAILIKSKYMDNGEVNISNSYISRFAPAKVLFSGSIHEQLDNNYVRKTLNIEVEHSGYFMTDKSSRNLSYLIKALEISPNDNYLLYQMAKTYYSSSQYVEAEPYFIKAYQNMDSIQGYTKDLIISFLNNCSKGVSIENGLVIIEDFFEFYNEDADFNFACGSYYLELALSDLNKYINCIPLIESSYKKCIALGENEIHTDVDGVSTYKAYHNLGAYYEVMGLKDKAKEAYNNASKYNYSPSIERLKAF